tara:strand:- start:124334 stop:125731 length:1398 start_codon:yes stop_codon:yes gene_type:complete
VKLREFTFESLSAAYRQKKVSPVEVAKETLAQTRRLNSVLNAVYFLDEDATLAKARESEQRYALKSSLGLMDGAVTTMKDALPVIGMPIYRGTASTPDEGLYYRWNAPATDRLLEEGVVIAGKNTMCDFGIIASGVSSRFGITRNPWNPQLTPGASSSGAAALVAAGLCIAAVGTDIVGSIRVPASYCGLVGLKPSYGRVPYYPPVSPALVAGPMARNMHDLAIMLDALAQPDSRDFTALAAQNVSYVSTLNERAKNPVFGLLESVGFGVPPDPEVIAATRRAAALFEAQGARVEQVSMPQFDPADLLLVEKFYRARTYAELNTAPLDHQKKSALMFKWAGPAKDDSAELMWQAMNAIVRLREQTMALVQGVNYLLLPATPTTAFKAEDVAPKGCTLFDAWCNTFLFNLTEQPALSICSGLSSNAMPIGLQIVGHRFDDMGVMQMGRWYETLRDLPDRRAPWGLS